MSKHLTAPSRILASLPAMVMACATFIATSASAVSLPDGTIPSNIGVQLKGQDMKPETLDLVRDLGVKWVRRGFMWEGVEKEKGVYDFSAYDKFVKDCKDRGLSVIGCIAFSNKLYGHPKDEPARTAYANYAAALAVHFKDEKVIWEIWNEPNTMTFWGHHGKKGNSEPYALEYTNLVKATVPAMKKANPNCIILAGSVSNMWVESYKWMDYCFADGMLKQKFDAWSVHPYGLKAPEDYIEAYGHMRQQMTSAGGPSDWPLVDSERGFPLGKKEGFAGGDVNKAYEYQSWHIVRQYLIDLMLGCRITSWYEWAGNEGFSLYRPGTPTPAYTATKVLINALSGYKLDKRIQTAQPRDFVLQFKNQTTGGIVLVAWTAPPPMQSPDQIVDHAITVPVQAAGALETTSLLGDKGTVSVTNGGIQLNLTGAPQYITLHK